MIVVKLKGGLGNQLFQYAFGYALSKNRHSEFHLDLSFLNGTYENKGFTQRGYYLKEYPIQANTLNQFKLARYFYPLTISTKIRMQLNQLRGKRSFVSFNDLNMTSLNRLPDSNLYFDGYWQDETYFYGFAEELRLQIIPFESRSVLFQMYFDDLQKSKNPISLHVRRGDYVMVEAYRKKYGTCPLEYYLRAMAYIRSIFPTPVFYIFSDDPDWVEMNFQDKEIHMVRGLEPHEDLQLMRQCRHHIIANSTFSWWGAWLGEREGSIIIAPKQWFADPEENNKRNHIVPNRWLRI